MRLPSRMLELLAGTAHYYSTHCLHGAHDQCKGTCKHCPAACRCICHFGQSRPPDARNDR